MAGVGGPTGTSLRSTPTQAWTPATAALRLHEDNKGFAVLQKRSPKR